MSPRTVDGRAVRRRVVLAALLVVSVAAGAPGAGGSPVADGDTTLVHEGGRLTLTNTTGQAVYGRTDRPPGTTLTVTLRSSGSSPFLMSTTATVTQSGRFRATFDLSPVAPGAEFTARVAANGTELASASGVTTACEGDCPLPAPATPAARITPNGNRSRTPTLAAGPGQAVSGRTNLPPGTRLTVRFRGIDGRLPPLETGTVVDDRGRFLAVADLSGVPAGTDLRLSVRFGGTRLVERRVTVVGCEEGCRPARRSGVANATPFVGRNSTTSPRVLETVQGRSVRLPLLLGDADTATLSVGGPAGRYALDLVVRDGNGDGRVGLVFDTANASDAGRAVGVVDDGDAVTVDHVTDGTDRARLAAGEYPLSLYRGADTDRITGLLVVRPAADGGASDRSVAEFTFQRSPLTAERGRTTLIPVALDETETATLSVNGSDYALRATVRDGSGDERVTLRFDTSEGADPRLTTVDENDTVRIRAEEGSVAPGEYRLTMYRGTRTIRNGWMPPDLWSARGTLIVSQAPSTPSADPGTPVDRLSLPALAALGLGGLLAVAGLGFLTGAFEP